MKQNDTLVINDARDNIRIEERRRVLWQTQDGEKKGIGHIRNISTSGMLLETNGRFKPTDQCLFKFDSDLGQKNFIPQAGRLVWFKKKGLATNRHLCGVKFVDTSDYVHDRLHQRIQQGIARLNRMRRITAVSNVILVLVMTGLTGYIVWMCQSIYMEMKKTNEHLLASSNKQAIVANHYLSLYEDTLEQLNQVKDELAVTQNLLVEASKELEATRVILQQTEIILTRVNQENSRLKEEMQLNTVLDNGEVIKTKAELESAIALLQEQNAQLNKEMVSIQDQIRLYESEGRDMDEVKELMQIYRNRMKALKSRVQFFKREARDAHVTAMKEKESIQTAIGNNGYFMKDGKAIHVDKERYEAAILEDAPSIEAEAINANSAPKVNINVDIVD